MFRLNLITRWFIYVAIAVITCIVGETTTSVLPVAWAIALKATLQGLIAWRAFIDGTAAWNKIDKRKKNDS
jgi:hypothetical protein